MHKYVLIIILIFTNNSQTEAQISNNASGKDLSNQYGTISYSIGEQFYVQKGTYYTLSEGVQYGNNNNYKPNSSTIKISIYPNPTSNLIKFQIQNTYSNNLSYRIFNNIGHELLYGRIENTNTPISLTQLPASIYLMKVYLEQQEVESIKLIKIN